MSTVPDCTHDELTVDHVADGFRATCRYCGKEATADNTLAAIGAMAGIADWEVPEHFTLSDGQWLRR